MGGKYQGFLFMQDLMDSSSSGDPAILSSLKLLAFYTREEKNIFLITRVEMVKLSLFNNHGYHGDTLLQTLLVLGKVLDTLCSLDQNLQCMSANILLNFFSNLPAK